MPTAKKARKHKEAFDLKDGGKSSRKFLLTITGMLLLCAMTVLGLVQPAVVALFPTFVAGLLGVLGLYFGGNVVNKAVVGNNLTKLDQLDQYEQEGEE